MRIEAEHFDIAVRTAYKKKNDAGILFDLGAMADFRATLHELAGKRKPTDAPVVTDEEFKAIKPVFNKLLTSAVKNFAPQSNEFKDNVNVRDYALVAHDYVVALMLDTLKCNEIPKKNYLQFGNDVSDLARDLIKAKSDKLKETKNFFDEQRRINADELEYNLFNLMGRVNQITSYPKPEEVGKLYGEYQALMQRQKKHGKIWRRFHKKENAKRTELLAKMKTILDKRLPSAIMSAAVHTPSQVQKYIEHKNMEDFIHQYVNVRDYSPASHMGYDEYINNPEALPEKQKVTIKDLVKVDYRPNVENLEEEMKVMQELRNAVVKGLLFKDNPALKQLVYRNHMRLGMAENMSRKPDWEKYCAGEDENFLAENPGFEVHENLPDEIPSLSEEPEAKEEPNAPEENKENSQREKIDGEQIKAAMGEKTVAIEEKRPEQPIVSSHNKNIV